MDVKEDGVAMCSHVEETVVVGMHGEPREASVLVTGCWGGWNRCATGSPTMRGFYLHHGWCCRDDGSITHLVMLMH